MALDHFIQPTVPDSPSVACRLGAGSGESNQLNKLDEGKLAKFAGESRYDICAVGDPIEGWIYAVELAPQNGFTIGSVEQRGRLRVTFDGSQAAGTGNVGLGTYVVAGTQPAKKVARTEPPRVRLATSQAIGAYNWRVVSLGTAGTGAPGTTGVIERI